MKSRFKIEFQKKQLYLDQDPGQPVIVDCTGGVPSYIPGFVPAAWTDMTEHTQGLEEFDLRWSAISGDLGNSVESTTETGSNYSKGLSTDLSFFGPAFQYIEEWLMTNPCQILNSINVRIKDWDCDKTYRIFELKVDNIEYAPEDEPCLVKVPLREADEAIHVFNKTIIEDNWQNWFNKEGTSTKDHPTFSMIVEKKPKFFLAINVVLLYIAGMLSVGLLVALNEGKRWIRRCLGFTYFCPSPLIRTYIQNICAKYGFTFDTIFDDFPANKYRDVCLFWPASTSLKNFDNFTAPSTKFIWDNRTVLPFTKFLNQLKKVFNAEWYVTPNKKLVFKHKSFFDTAPPLYDFTVAGADKLYHLKYTFNGKKKPAYGDYKYLTDPQDTCSNELKYRYNAIVDYDGPANNPMMEGHIDKNVDFAATSFHKDGSSEDFLQEGVELGRLIAVGAIILGLGQLFLASNFLTAAIVAGLLTAGYIITNDFVNNFFDTEELNGIVRVSNSEVNQPRLLLYDRLTPMDKSKVVWVEDPVPVPYYNPDLKTYYEEHPAYEAPGYFGGTVTRVYNYPMYFEEMFADNLFDNFHEYDNPLKNPEINQTWKGEVDLCCEWLNRLGVWEGDYIKIGSVLSLEDRHGRIIKGRIDDIQPNYKTGAINLSGTVLK